MNVSATDQISQENIIYYTSYIQILTTKYFSFQYSVPI